MWYRKFFKSIVDFVVAFCALLLLSPIFVTVMVCLLINNKGTPFFIQSRPGHKGILFNIIKFKTMNSKRGDDGELLPDAERLTRLGKWVRKSSIDEIPQLVNVLKGEMSLIGPRPLLPEYLFLYTKEQFRRHEVKPGITGWAQVNGRNALSWKEKFQFDVWYVDNISLSLDLKIIVLTIKKVLKREGISSATSVTMEKFKGN